MTSDCDAMRSHDTKMTAVTIPHADRNAGYPALFNDGCGDEGAGLAMGTYNAMFWRMAMGALVAVLYLPTQPAPASGKVLRIHIIRAALTAVMAYLFFFGLTRIPLAQAIGLSFIAPIITLFLAVPILGERIGANAKLAAVLVLVASWLSWAESYWRLMRGRSAGYDRCAGVRGHVRLQPCFTANAGTDCAAAGNRFLSKCDCVSAAIGRCALCRHVARQPSAVGRRGAGGRFCCHVSDAHVDGLQTAEAQRLVAIEYTALSGLPCWVGGFLPRR